MSLSNVYVRNVPEEDRIQINLSYTLNEKTKEFNMNRSKTEQLSETLNRLSQNLIKWIEKYVKIKIFLIASVQSYHKCIIFHLKRTAKKKKKTEESQNLAEVNVSLSNAENVIDTTMNTGDAWSQDNILKINDEKFKVEVNLPSIKAVNISDSILSGFPVLFQVESEFTDLKLSEFIWFKEIKEEEEKNGKKILKTHWKEISRGKECIPGNDDVGSRIKCTIIPKNCEKPGIEKSSESKCIVNAGPGLCPFEERHLYTTESSEKDW